jgi:hypothetical protein
LSSAKQRERTGEKGNEKTKLHASCCCCIIRKFLSFLTHTTLAFPSINILMFMIVLSIMPLGSNTLKMIYSHFHVKSCFPTHTKWLSQRTWNLSLSPRAPHLSPSLSNEKKTSSLARRSERRDLHKSTLWRMKILMFSFDLFIFIGKETRASQKTEKGRKWSRWWGSRWGKWWRRSRRRRIWGNLRYVAWAST